MNEDFTDDYIKTVIAIAFNYGVYSALNPDKDLSKEKEDLEENIIQLINYHKNAHN